MNASRILTLATAAIIMAPALTACAPDAPVDSPMDDLLTVYSLRRVDPNESFGNSWLPLNPTTYRVGESAVVEKTAQFLTRHTNCAVLTKEDWECKYEDSSGSFGFRDGEFWRDPRDPETRIVSRLDYLKVKCEWRLAEIGRKDDTTEMTKCLATGP